MCNTLEVITACANNTDTIIITDVDTTKSDSNLLIFSVSSLHKSVLNRFVSNIWLLKLEDKNIENVSRFIIFLYTFLSDHTCSSCMMDYLQ